jgi:type II secretory pathway pseudopilin PulG
LIVIIVIGILAAIIIVAYNGVTNSAKDSAAKTSAVTLQKKLEAYNAQTGSYPIGTGAGVLGATGALNSTTTSALTGTGLTLATATGVAAGAVTATNGQNTVLYEACTTGYKISYWDYKATTQAIGSGQIKGGAVCSPYAQAY